MHPASSNIQHPSVHIGSEMSMSPATLLISEEEAPTSIEQISRNFTNGDVLALFSNPRTLPAMVKYYRTIRRWHIAVFITAVFSALVYGHFSLAKVWTAIAAPPSCGAFGRSTVFMVLGSITRVRNPGAASLLPDFGPWLRRKGWVIVVEPSDATKAIIAARRRYGAVPSAVSTSAAAITGPSASCPEAASLQAESEPRVALSPAQERMLGMEPLEFTVSVCLFVIIFALLPTVLEVYIIVTNVVFAGEPPEAASWRAGRAAAGATLAVLLSVDLVVLQRSKIGIQALLDQELLLRHQASA
ncbi:unnamed protein product [Mortierella alpina]